MALTKQEKDVFGKSMRRCLSNPTFLDRFYELFLSSSDEVRAKFQKTSLDHQKILLKGSLFIVEMMSDGSVKGGTQIEKLANVHNHQARNINPELYDLWTDSMVRAVRESDPECDNEIERIWREGVKNCVQFMTSRY